MTQDEAGDEDGAEAKSGNGGRRGLVTGAGGRSGYGECERMDAGRFGGVDDLDVGDEAVAGGWDCLDEAGLAAVVVEGLAEQADGAGEGAFGDGGIGPDGVEEFLLADEAAAVLDEVEEQAESLGLKGDGRAVRNEAEGGVVGLKAIEAEDHR